MTVFDYIILLFKRPGVPGKNEKKRLLISLKAMTEIFTFKLEQPLNDIDLRFFAFKLSAWRQCGELLWGTREYNIRKSRKMLF